MIGNAKSVRLGSRASGMIAFENGGLEAISEALGVFGKHTVPVKRSAI